MAKFLAYIMGMKIANIAEFKNSLSSYLAAVALGEEVEIRKRNIPIARVVPVQTQRKNETVLGCGRGSVRINGDLTDPLMPENDWEMLQDDGNADSS
ncbi:MAG: type II toxin-antitoxin system prevent-host-death family antitoxin [Acidobacteria bacterium]|nr:MAG: type II toxin-antitoxin system prevent-host-death family antitoxin [Acidobacteriota bacterium]